MPLDPGDDTQFVELYDELAASWAQLEIGEDGFIMAAEFARAAWACGYAAATGQLAVA